MAKFNGIIIRTKSAFNGEPIIVVIKRPARGKRHNSKTGDVVQVSYLVANEEPHCATKDGADYAICANCGLRRWNGGGCYVRTDQGPLAQYRAIMRGRYLETTWVFLERACYDMGLQGLFVRFGSYGDPASITAYKHNILYNALRPRAHTGYTRQWSSRPDLSLTCMASTQTPAQGRMARERGFRTFRVTGDLTTRERGEIVCKNTTDGRLCLDCGLCSGLLRGVQSVVIAAHGAKAKRALSAEREELQENCNA